MPRNVLRLKPITLFELASLTLSSIGILSLVFIYAQVGATRTQTRALTTQAVMAQLLSLDKLFIDHSELRPYFYHNKDISEDDANYEKVLAIAEFQLDFFDSFLTQADYLTLSPEERRAWENYIRDSFTTSPAMCRRLKDSQDWYTDLKDFAKCP